VAEKIASKARRWRPLGGNSVDTRHVREAFGGTVARWRVAALTEWFNSPEIWPWVEVLARELVAKAELDGDQVHELLEPMGWPAKPRGFADDMHAWALQSAKPEGAAA
jgi:hypothetical protein